VDDSLPSLTVDTTEISMPENSRGYIPEELFGAAYAQGSILRNSFSAKNLSIIFHPKILVKSQPKNSRHKFILSI
jgi:hypothetical protein